MSIKDIMYIIQSKSYIIGLILNVLEAISFNIKIDRQMNNYTL